MEIFLEKLRRCSFGMLMMFVQWIESRKKEPSSCPVIHTNSDLIDLKDKSKRESGKSEKYKSQQTTKLRF